MITGKQSAIQFGTDGIRGRVGTNFFVQEHLGRFGRAFALWLRTRINTRTPRVLLVSDTRASCSWVKSCLGAGMCAYTIDVYDCGVIPTPAAFVAMTTGENTFDAALIISASHNAYHDNGIKIMLNSGKLSSDDEALLAACFEGGEKYRQEQTYDGTLIGYTAARQCYIDFIVSSFPQNFLINKTVILDCAHGSACTTAPEIFEKLGARVIAINTLPNGKNINELCGSLHPEGLQRKVLEEKADIGFAFDGDADRVLAVAKNGTIKDGDDLLALLMQHPAYATTDIVVGTTMTNMGCEQHFADQGKRLIRTSVGDKFIAEALNNNKLSLGGEPVGHIIVRDLLPVGDGTVAALRVLESLTATDNWDMKTFVHYPQAVSNMPIQERRDLTTDPYASILQDAEMLVGRGRIVVRYSGTEPVLRIMAEAESSEMAQQTVDFITQSFKPII